MISVHPRQIRILPVGGSADLQVRIVPEALFPYLYLYIPDNQSNAPGRPTR